VILLDAFALIALLVDEPAADDVAGLLREQRCGVTAVNLAETLDVAVRVLGQPADTMEGRLAPLLATVLAVTAVEEADGRRAARLRWRHYHRQRAPLSLADCLLLAVAAARAARLATSDGPLAAAARQEGVAVLPLPNSRGERP
jgi:predicted nucleic acid-binding protein